MPCGAERGEMSSTGPCNESHSLKASRWPSSAEAGVIPRETSEGPVRLANVKGGGGQTATALSAKPASRGGEVERLDGR